MVLRPAPLILFPHRLNHLTKTQVHNSQLGGAMGQGSEQGDGFGNGIRWHGVDSWVMPS